MEPTPLRNPRNEMAQQGADSSNARVQPSERDSILNLQGFLDTVNTIPTQAPRTFNESIRVYVDSYTSPTVRRLYIYSPKLKDWLYTTLST